MTTPDPAATLRRWDVWRRIDPSRPGIVDLLGTVSASTRGEAENLSKLAFPVNTEKGESLYVTEYLDLIDGPFL